MCDFGISGYLVDSVAKTIDAGCKPYMAVRFLTLDSLPKTLIVVGEASHLPTIFPVAERLNKLFWFKI